MAKEPYHFLNFPEIPYPSNINSATINMTSEAGNAGNVYVEAKHIRLEQGGTITSLSYGGGNAGNTEVIADTIYITGAHYTNTRYYRSGINSSSINPTPYAGRSGNIDVVADQVVIQDGGAINTSALNAGGGNITFNIYNFLYVFDQGRITTSVQSGFNNGGNITINSPQFLILNHSPIVAQVDAGQGGNIRIVANQFIKDPISVVSASSRLGIDGNIEITSPDETITSGLHTLSKNFSEQAQIKDACKAAIAGQLPTEFQPLLTFKMNMYRFPNDFIDDWIPSAASRLRLSTCK